MPKKTTATPQSTVRPPVIAIMGHVDHGKSTLLDYIRKTNIVDTEAGGITQKISAYEVTHKADDGRTHRITFLDTPGHAAFQAMRSRGATVADIAVLVVSAEDGVRPQTVESYKTIKAAGIPFIVAINKIDKEGANIDSTKNSLAENEIYVEGFGGDVPFVAISAKTGKGIPELLDTLILQAEVVGLTGNASATASGIVIEANLDKQKGISAALIIKNGTLSSGQYIVAGSAISPVRIMENFLGKPLKEASFSSPVRIIGWSSLPDVGSTFTTFSTKKEAEEFILAHKKAPAASQSNRPSNDDIAVFPIVIKAREVGGLDALQHEISKIHNDKIKIRIISSGVGDITENDVKAASGSADTVILGFNTKLENVAKFHAEKMGIPIHVFDIIYKLTEWIEEAVATRAPKTRFEDQTGLAKVLKVFSKTKDKQILGGRVEKGLILLNAEVKIMRRDFEIGRGKVRELQKFKGKVSEVPEGQEFGTMIESKTEIAPGDKLEAFQIIEK